MRVMRIAAILVMSVITLVAAALGQRAETSQGLAASHEKAPTMPWMPRAITSAEPLTHCGVWERDGYESIQVNVDARGCNIVGDAANEPSIAIDPIDRRKIIIGWRQFDSVLSTFRQAGYAYSHDGGHTWLFPGSLMPGVSHSDPVLAADANGIIYYHGITVPQTRGDLFRSLDGGITWLEPVAGLSGDKPWMAVDQTTGTGTGNLYICNRGAFAKSTDRGENFVQVPSDGCPAGTATVGASGLVYMTGGYLGCPDFTRSFGVPDPTLDPSFAPPIEFRFASCPAGGGPNPDGLLMQHWVGTGTESAGTQDDVYVVSLATLDPLGIDTADVVFMASRDGGITWNERPVLLNNDPMGPDNLQWFPTMCVAPNGRIDVVWNDTRNSLQPNLSELFYSYSEDGGRTWSQNIPVSPMFDSWVGFPGGWPSGNVKMGDYYHCVSENLGVNVAYAATFNGEQDIYFLRIGPWDCNGNEIDDAVDISSEASSDCNGNEVPDECEYRVDIDGDGLTTIEDFTALAERLATEPQSHEATEGIAGCDQLFDADHDGDIDLADFAYLQRVFVGE